MDPHFVTPVTYVPVIRRKGEYTVLYEQVGDCTFVHVDVEKWTLSTLRHFKQDIERAASLHGGPFFVLVPTHDTKLRKFCMKFGFEHAMDLTTKNGDPGEILIKRI